MLKSRDADPREQSRSAQRLTDHVVAAIEAARAVEKPFLHLELENVFPPDVYEQMLAMMPVSSDYRPMSGRAKGLDAADGTHTRVKIDLFPELLRALPPEKRALWSVVGQALRSEAVKAAFIRRLAPGLSRRFGRNFAAVEQYAIPVLTRDISGYHIDPHTDTRWKGITVQLYLPPDSSISHIGTIFHDRLADGSMPKAAQRPFVPNGGYAFAVGDNTWHSVDTVGPEVKTRDSILLTYFVDQGSLRFLRNRAKRVGNWIRSEVTRLTGR